MKRGKLSKVEQFYIQSNKSTSVEELAQDLDRSTEVVSAFLEKVKPVEPSVKNEQPKRGPAYTQFARQTSEGVEVPGITISTQSASAASDEWRQTTNRGTPSKYKGCVSRVHTDKPSETN